MTRLAWLLVLLLAGCVPQPPLTAADIQARRFELPAGKAAIYIVRDDPDFSDEPAAISLDGEGLVTTFPGTYYRWEVEPGVHRITGFGADAGGITLDVQADRLYFVQQRVSRLLFRSPLSHFFLIPEPHGRAVVHRSVLVGG